MIFFIDLLYPSAHGAWKAVLPSLRLVAALSVILKWFVAYRKFARHGVSRGRASGLGDHK